MQYRQNQPSDGPNKTLKSEAAQKTPDDVKIAKKSNVSASRSATQSSRSSAKSTPQMSMPKIKDKSVLVNICHVNNEQYVAMHC